MHLPFKRPIEDLKAMYMSWVPVPHMEPILPPTIMRPPRRLEEMRKNDDEVFNPKLSKRGKQANCIKCGKTGHGKRTCKGEVGANQPIRRPPPSSQQQQPGRHPSPRATTWKAKIIDKKNFVPTNCCYMDA
ncbi:hypothetical protein GQ457_11G031360 [Hibiscus cannabinus]